MADEAFKILIGFATGFVSGSFGVGGGLITTPAMRMLLGYPAEIALGTPLPITIPSVLTGSVNYYKAGYVKKSLILPCITGGLFGSIIGASLTGFVNASYLMLLTAIAIAFFGVRMMVAEQCEMSEDEGACTLPSIDGMLKKKLLIIGAAGGFYSGLLGLGGGTIITPLMFFWLGISIKYCIGTALASVIVIVVPGSLIHWALGHIDAELMLLIGIGTIPGAMLGSRIAVSANTKRLQTVLGFVLAVVGTVFFINEIASL